MALDITSGLNFLHSKEIIHRDLHSKNILVNNGRLLIADFGLSKKLAEVSTNSIGVLLWEISSGRIPFFGCTLLEYHIKNGGREDPIEGTPPKYEKLYQECWDDKPESRPDIEKVHEILGQLNTENSSDLQSSLNKSNSEGDDLYISDYPREKVKNLLIIGGTLSGKSLLSNILCDIENGCTSNETKDLSKKDFEWNGTKYHVIEIVIWSIEKVIYNKITDLMPEGISQFLFLVDESFTTREEIMFELFKKIIFETGILQYVTIIQNKRERDQKYVFENKIIAEIVKSCNGVDNFSIDIDKEENNNDYEGQNIIDRNVKKEIRNKLLNYLEENFQEKYYKLEKWDDIYSKIANYAKSDMSFVEVEKADITNMTSDIFKNLFNYIDSESKKRDQQWFNEKYSEAEVMDITDNRRLNLTDSLKIEGFENLKRIRIKKFKLISLEIRNCSQLNEINLVELPILTSLSVTGCSNLTMITELTSLKISDCSQLNKVYFSNLPKIKSLSVINCSKLTNFNCSSTELASLKISNCPQVDLSKLPKIISLNLIYCSNLTTLDFSSNELTSLKIINCSQLNKIDLSRISRIMNLSIISFSTLITFDNLSTGLTSLKISDHSLSKFTKLESLSITECTLATKLTNLKIIGYSQLNKADSSNLSKTMSLSVIYCSNITMLDCSLTELTSLEISDFSNNIDLSKLTKLNSLSLTKILNLLTFDFSSITLTSLKISNCSQLNKVNLSKFPKLTSLSVTNCQKLTNLDCSSTELIRLKISCCSQIYNIDLSKLSKLEGLSVTECSNLTTLNISSIGLTSLKISDCSQLEGIDLSEFPNLMNLSVTNCQNLPNLDCSSIKALGQKHEFPNYFFTNSPAGRKNLLIIGTIHSGKSALANVICKTKFFEENGCNSKDFQEYDFVWNNTNYHVVDIRVNLIENEILYKIGQVIYSMPEGISQILFVVDHRLTAEEIKKLSEIEEEILKIEICKITTIVRTKFEDFKSKDECKKDEENLYSLNKKIFIKNIFTNKPPIIHVDNPSAHIYVYDSDDDATVNYIGRGRREKSRTILLEHLNKVCSEKYKLNMWDKLYESNMSIDNLDKQKLIKSYLKLYDPDVVKIIKKLVNGE
ncbi:unnamed protein product [Rhizophagus irregularis]|nr:unnamed protein product [Rhizophagus irregularis]